MNNDIERYDFWNREMEEFLKEERRKELEKIMRWDSVANKVPPSIIKIQKERKITETFHRDIPNYLHH